MKKEYLEIQIFTRVTKDTDKMIEELAVSQERSKSFVLRKAIQNYLEVNYNQI